MKKMREINYILYVLVTYLLSSLYGIIFRWEVPRILKIENLNNLSILFLVLLIIGYLITNFFKSLKEVFRSGVKKSPYILVIIYGVNINNVALIYAVSICLIVAYAVLFLENRQIEKKEKTGGSENGKEPKLYPSRRNLMEVLNHALREYSLIALDGTWGSGKTTFMNIFMRDNRDKFYYIPINIMLFENRNSLKTEFLNQLKVVFKEEGIFQGSLIDFDYYLDGISNDWVKVIKNIVFSKSKSFKEANENLKSEIGKIEKTIVVGVDNLERIYGESEQEWKQILGFIHELQELGIKIVVMANFKKMYGNKKDSSTDVYLNRFNYNLNLLEQEKNSDDKFKTSAEECLLCSKILADNLKIKPVVFNENGQKNEKIKYFATIQNSIYEKLPAIKEKDNFINRNEYFDKFFEIRLNLQSVSTSEIIDILIETSESDFKKWLEENGGWLKEEIKKLEIILNHHLTIHELGNKYNENGVSYRYYIIMKNPRKLKKIIDDMYLKKGLCKELYAEIKGEIGKDRENEILFAMSLFKLYFPDYIKEYTIDGFKDGEFSFYIYNYIFPDGEVNRKKLNDKKLGKLVANMINKLLENLN